MSKAVINYNKYENYIRIGHNGTEVSTGVYTCDDLKDFPTPSILGRKLHDTDKDAFTDLQGYTHRNRVRSEVEDITLTYNILSDDDESFILEMIKPEWIYVELINKRTKQKEVHKMYASDKEWDTFMVWKDDDGNWHTEDSAFTFSLVEE